MTMTFRFFAAACPCTNGLTPIRAVPRASPAVLRRKSRLLQPRCLASSYGAGIGVLNDEAVNSSSPFDSFSLDDAPLSFTQGLGQSRALRNRQIAVPPPFPYRLRPCAGPGA